MTPSPRGSIREVAVIGAGISGIASAAHLLRHGFRVVVFERSSVAGGVWHFDPRAPPEPPYPNERPPQPSPAPPTPRASHTSDTLSPSSYSPDESSTDRDPPLAPGSEGKEERGDVNLDFAAASLRHAPPGPCYAGLRNNVPTTLMRSTLLDWPAGTPEFVGRDRIERYVQDLAAHTGVQAHVLYDTGVEAIWKDEDGKKPASTKEEGEGVGEDVTSTSASTLTSNPWHVRTKTLQRSPTSQAAHFHTQEWTFDAVVVGSGHYHEPRVPAVPGLELFKKRFPSRVIHSKAYRRPDAFRDRTVLIVGAGVSALDIAKEMMAVGGARRVYQSARGGAFDLPATLLPKGAERVAGVKEFVLYDDADADGNGDDTSGSIPGEVRLADGRRLTDIDAVVLATGYLTSYAFLGADLQSSTTPAESADERIIVTSDGHLTHNLHRDVFWIPDPSLAFVGVPFYSSTFSLFDFQAEVVARVWAGRSHAPLDGVAMRQEYRARWREAFDLEAKEGQNQKGGAVGGMRQFHSLWGREVAYMDGILDWVNGGQARGRRPEGLGEEAVTAPMQGVDERWRARHVQFQADLLKARASGAGAPVASDAVGLVQKMKEKGPELSVLDEIKPEVGAVLV